MAFVLADRVLETSSTTGTADLVLGGAPLGYQAFSAVMSTGDTSWYAIELASAGEWEVGTCTFNAGVMQRTSVLASSAGGAKVAFSAGEKKVAITPPAVMIKRLQQMSAVALSGSAEDLAEGATKKLLTTAERTKLGHITVTQAVDLDAIEARVIALDAAIILKGTWNAGSGAFPGSGTAQAGESWIVSGAGTVNGVAFAVNDRIIAITDNASTTTFAANWFKADYTDQVLSVAGRQGNVTLTADDVPDGTTNKAFTAGEKTKLAGVEAGADVTDAANVAPSLRSSIWPAAQLVADWNSANVNGWYMAAGASNAPEADYWFIGHVWQHNAGYLVQEVTSFMGATETNSRTYMRLLSNGVWQPWWRVRKTQAELDARYGLRTSLAVTAASSPTADWNTITANGWYFSNDVAANQPSAHYFMGEMVIVDSSYAYQTIVRLGTSEMDTGTWRRIRNAAGWSGWFRIDLSLGEMDARYSSGLVLLSSQTVSSTVVTLDFTTGINDTYDEYEVHLQGVLPSANGAHFSLLTSSDGGASYDTANGAYKSFSSGGVSNSAQPIIANSNSAVSIALCTNVWNTAGFAGVDGVIKLVRPSDTVRYKNLLWDVVFNSSSGILATHRGGGQRVSTSAVNAIRFSFSSGGISAGYFKLYGVKK